MIKNADAATVKRAAKGQWLSILAGIVPELESAVYAAGKHVDCPFHGGQKDFRFYLDAAETGGAVCTCGQWADGYSLLMEANHWSFSQAVDAVANFLNLGSADSGASERAQQRMARVEEKMKRKAQVSSIYAKQLERKLTRLWNESIPYDDPVAAPMRKYLVNRGLVFDLTMLHGTDSLRFHPKVQYFNDDGLVGDFPAMLGAIRDQQGNIITLHRTYLTPDGHKASVESAKKLSSVPSGKALTGGAIRLGSPVNGVIGVAEGIETALSVYRSTHISTWSVVNAQLMQSFAPPQGVHTVLIWADYDRSQTGQNAAQALKDKLEEQGIRSLVICPKIPIPAMEKGVDWNDVLMTQGRLGFPDLRYLHQQIAQ